MTNCVWSRLPDRAHSIAIGSHYYLVQPGIVVAVAEDLTILRKSIKGVIKELWADQKKPVTYAGSLVAAYPGISATGLNLFPALETIAVVYSYSDNGRAVLQAIKQPEAVTSIAITTLQVAMGYWAVRSHVSRAVDNFSTGSAIAALIRVAVSSIAAVVIVWATVALTSQDTRFKLILDGVEAELIQANLLNTFFEQIGKFVYNVANTTVIWLTFKLLWALTDIVPALVRRQIFQKVLAAMAAICAAFGWILKSQLGSMIAVGAGSFVVGYFSSSDWDIDLWGGAAANETSNGTLTRWLNLEDCINNVLKGEPLNLLSHWMTHVCQMATGDSEWVNSQLERAGLGRTDHMAQWAGLLAFGVMGGMYQSPSGPQKMFYNSRRKLDRAARMVVQATMYYSLIRHGMPDTRTASTSVGVVPDAAFWQSVNDTGRWSAGANRNVTWLTSTYELMSKEGTFLTDVDVATIALYRADSIGATLFLNDERVTFKSLVETNAENNIDPSKITLQETPFGGNVTFAKAVPRILTTRFFQNGLTNGSLGIPRGEIAAFNRLPFEKMYNAVMNDNPADVNSADVMLVKQAALNYFLYNRNPNVEGINNTRLAKYIDTAFPPERDLWEAPIALRDAAWDTAGEYGGAAWDTAGEYGGAAWDTAGRLSRFAGALPAKLKNAASNSIMYTYDEFQGAFGDAWSGSNLAPAPAPPPAPPDGGGGGGGGGARAESESEPELDIDAFEQRLFDRDQQSFVGPAKNYWANGKGPDEILNVKKLVCQYLLNVPSHYQPVNAEHLSEALSGAGDGSIVLSDAEQSAITALKDYKGYDSHAEVDTGALFIFILTASDVSWEPWSKRLKSRKTTFEAMEASLNTAYETELRAAGAARGAAAPNFFQEYVIQSLERWDQPMFPSMDVYGWANDSGTYSDRLKQALLECFNDFLDNFASTRNPREVGAALRETIRNFAINAYLGEILDGETRETHLINLGLAANADDARALFDDRGRLLDYRGLVRRFHAITEFAPTEPGATTENTLWSDSLRELPATEEAGPSGRTAADFGADSPNDDDELMRELAPTPASRWADVCFGLEMGYATTELEKNAMVARYATLVVGKPDMLEVKGFEVPRLEDKDPFFDLRLRICARMPAVYTKVQHLVSLAPKLLRGQYELQLLKWCLGWGEYVRALPAAQAARGCAASDLHAIAIQKMREKRAEVKKGDRKKLAERYAAAYCTIRSRDDMASFDNENVVAQLVAGALAFSSVRGHFTEQTDKFQVEDMCKNMQKMPLVNAVYGGDICRAQPIMIHALHEMHNQLFGHTGAGVPPVFLAMLLQYDWRVASLPSDVGTQGAFDNLFWSFLWTLFSLFIIFYVPTLNQFSLSPGQGQPALLSGSVKYPDEFTADVEFNNGKGSAFVKRGDQYIRNFADPTGFLDKDNGKVLVDQLTRLQKLARGEDNILAASHNVVNDFKVTYQAREQAAEGAITEFTVPEKLCAAQVLKAQLAVAAAAERNMQLILWRDALVQPMEGDLFCGPQCTNLLKILEGATVQFNDIKFSFAIPHVPGFNVLKAQAQEPVSMDPGEALAAGIVSGAQEDMCIIESNALWMKGAKLPPISADYLAARRDIITDKMTNATSADDIQKLQDENGWKFYINATSYAELFFDFTLLLNLILPPVQFLLLTKHQAAIDESKAKKLNLEVLWGAVEAVKGEINRNVWLDLLPPEQISDANVDFRALGKTAVEILKKVGNAQLALWKYTTEEGVKQGILEKINPVESLAGGYKTLLSDNRLQAILKSIVAVASQAMIKMNGIVRDVKGKSDTLLRLLENNNYTYINKPVPSEIFKEAQKRRYYTNNPEFESSAKVLGQSMYVTFQQIREDDYNRATEEGKVAFDKQIKETDDRLAYLRTFGMLNGKNEIEILEQKMDQVQSIWNRMPSVPNWDYIAITGVAFLGNSYITWKAPLHVQDAHADIKYSSIAMQTLCLVLKLLRSLPCDTVPHKEVLFYAMMIATAFKYPVYSRGATDALRQYWLAFQDFRKLRSKSEGDSGSTGNVQSDASGYLELLLAQVPEIEQITQRIRASAASWKTCLLGVVMNRAKPIVTAGVGVYAGWSNYIDVVAKTTIERDQLQLLHTTFVTNITNGVYTNKSEMLNLASIRLIGAFQDYGSTLCSFDQESMLQVLKTLFEKYNGAGDATKEALTKYVNDFFMAHPLEAGRFVEWNWIFNGLYVIAFLGTVITLEGMQQWNTLEEGQPMALEEGQPMALEGGQPEEGGGSAQPGPLQSPNTSPIPVRRRNRRSQKSISGGGKKGSKTE